MSEIDKGDKYQVYSTQQNDAALYESEQQNFDERQPEVSAEPHKEAELNDQVAPGQPTEIQPNIQKEILENNQSDQQAMESLNLKEGEETPQVPESLKKEFSISVINNTLDEGKTS